MEIAKTYVELPALKLAGKSDVDALIAYAHSGENVVPFDKPETARPSEPRTASEKRDGEPKGRRAGRTPRLRRRLLAVASCALIFVATGAVWWQSTRYPIYATDIGERRSMTLADGSTVDLNARSKLRIRFTNDERRVELLGGQALFQVAKDKNRPFIVASGDATVRAVGTQFDVHRKDSGTTVTVLEGRVAVYSSAYSKPNASGSAEPPSAGPQTAGPPHASAPISVPGHSPATALSWARVVSTPSNPPGLADPSGSAAIILSAGEQVTVSSPEVLPAPAHADIAATTAWMQRRLIFDGSKLSDVVQEFNRFNKRQLVIEGEKLSDFRVSGVYSSTDPVSFVRFLREQPGMKITEDDNEVRIESP